MTQKDSAISNYADDADSVRPMLDDDWFAEADAFQGDTLVRRGRPKSDNPKQSVTIRLDRDLVDWFRDSGEGWQTRINSALRKVAGL